MTERRVIGLTGGMCSGNDSWAFFLKEEFGYAYRSLSDIVRNYIDEHKLGEPTRDLTREATTHDRSLYGNDFLACKALEDAGDSDRIVISSIYVGPEVLKLKNVGGYIVNIVTNETLRFARMSKSGRSGEAPELEEYSRLTNNDLHAVEADQRLCDVIDLTDYHIDGTLSMQDDRRLYRKVTGEMLNKITGDPEYV